METFSVLLAICVGIHRSQVNSPHKGQWRGALMFSLICVWINDWVNNPEAGDLRRYRAYYDGIVMFQLKLAEVFTHYLCDFRLCRLIFVFLRIINYHNVTVTLQKIGYVL